MTTQEAQSKAEVITSMLRVIGDTLRDNMPTGTPSGTLYAVLMAHGCTMQQYEAIVDAFKSVGKVREQGNVLYWIA